MRDASEDHSGKATVQSHNKVIETNQKSENVLRQASILRNLNNQARVSVNGLQTDRQME